MMTKKNRRGALLAAVVATGLAIAQANSAAHAEDSRFDVLEFVVEGNTKLAQEKIERAVYAFLGEQKSVTDVEGARQALEKAYHDAGYLTVLVDIPPQRISAGEVSLRVTEAPVDRLRIVGSEYHSLGVIRETVPSLAEGSVPNFGDVQKEVAALNRSADRSVTPVMRPSATPGKVEVELQVKDQLPLHGSVEINDHYSLNTTHTRATAQVRYDNLWQRQHSISLQYQTAPEKPDETRVASLSYVMPGEDGWTNVFYAVRSRSKVATIGDLNVLGNADIAGLRFSRALPAEGADLYQSLTLGVDYKRSLENLVQGTSSVETPITYLPFSAQYSGTLQEASGSATTLDAGVGFIVRGLKADPAEFANKRALADTSYAALRLGVQRMQALPLGWRLRAKLDGQAASGPLISNEQFAGGGAASVRGYRESEAVGDDGVHGVLELQSPRLVAAENATFRTLYALAFIEGAHLRVLDPLPAQQARFTLASAGLGLRVEAKGMSLDIDAAHVFRDVSLTTGAGNTRAGDNRLGFKGSYEF